MFKLNFNIHDHTYLAERIDKLTMFYVDRHYNIKTMSVDEFVKTFDKVRFEVTAAVQAPKNRDSL